MNRDDYSQANLFDTPKTWEEYWRGMPAFNQEDLSSFQHIKVHFRDTRDRQAFAELVNQRLTDKTKYIWYPKAQFDSVINDKYISKNPLNPRYPVYIISKGRWESRLTSKALEKINVPYYIVIEPQEYDDYAAVIDPAKILVLPFSNLGKGSIPARNWVWEHSISLGAERHWILDDNIAGFFRYHNNRKVHLGDGTFFYITEDFVNRYTNIALSGLQYAFFVPRRDNRPAFTLNTRIYSCILIKNDIPYRWRGRYNEDTDLSIRVLKDGWCTVLFYAFLARKQATMTMKGGNTDELYKDDGRLKMAQALQEQHPDIVTITRKWDRWQHQVDYSWFIKHNKLIPKSDVIISEEMNNYGMELITISTNESTNFNEDF